MLLLLASCGGSGGIGVSGGGAGSTTTPVVVPAGPAALAQDDLVFNSNRPGNQEIFAMKTDGSKIAMFGSVGSTLQIFVTDAQDQNAVAYTNRPGFNTDVSWSPNGQTLLFNGCPSAFPTPRGNLGAWAIRIAQADGSNARDLINDGQINSKPAWSLDGRTIYFHRMEPPDYRFRVFRIGQDGTGLKELTVGVAGSHEYPAN